VRWKPIRRNSDPRVRYRRVFKSRVDNKFVTLPHRISNKHYTGDGALFHKSVKARKSTSVLIRWQIVKIRPNCTQLQHTRHRMGFTRSWRTPASDKPKRVYGYLSWQQSSNISQHRKSFINHDVHMLIKIHLLFHSDPQIVYRAHPIQYSSGFRVSYKITLQIVLENVIVLHFSRTNRTVCSDQTEFLYSPENLWKEGTVSYHRRRTVHGRNRKSPIFCWKIRWHTMVQDDFPVGHPISPWYPWNSVVNSYLPVMPHSPCQIRF
jgi:hypothetical protein